MKSYGNSTEEFLRNVTAKEQKDYILKEIAQNLAYIADELADANKINKKSLKEAYESIAGSDRTECVSTDKCFICGRPVDFAKVGGTVITDDGDFFFACANCKERFDALVQVFVMPNEVFC